MGLFGCNHRWGRWNKPQKGYKQRKCLKCGRLKRQRVSQFWCTHRYGARIKGRKNAPKVVRCSKCGKEKRLS